MEDLHTFHLIVSDWINYIRPYVLEKFPYKDGAVIQAGGNCGVYPLLFSEFFNNVYTFEPDPLNFFCLTNNCQATGIVKFNCALDEKPRLMTIKEVNSSNRGMNKVEPYITDKSNRLSVPSISIDSLNLQRVKLIQLDLEGFELQAINGAKKTIRKNKPIIILESSITNDLVYFKKIESLMNTLNYTTDRQLTRLDTAFIPKE